MIWSDDPIRDYDRWESEQYLEELKYPICCDCGEHIMGEYLWDFHGCYYCEDCVSNHRCNIDNYIQGR